MRMLGIDYGDKHVGVAIGDDEMSLALPLETFENKGAEQFIVDIKTVIARESAELLVVGVPQTGNAFGHQRAVIEAVVARLAAELALPVKIVDESFSSKQAQRMIHETKRKDIDDHAIAAMLILQSYLDRA